MKNSDKTMNHNEILQLPVVRIDTLDQQYIQPLREFFSINSCQVFVNSSPTQSCTYHIITGDQHFVESILEKQRITSQKEMIIMWDINEKDVAVTKSSPIKVALVDPKTIDGELLGNLCNFFFTGNQKIKSFQTIIPQQKNEERPKPRETHDERKTDEKMDTQRIAKVIAQEFVTPKETKPRHKNHTFLSVGLLFGILITPIIVYFGSLSLIIASLYQQTSCIQKSMFCSFPTGRYTKQLIQTSREAFSIAKIPLALTNQSNTISKNENIINALEKLSAILVSSGEMNSIASNFITSFLTTDLSKQDDTSTVVQVEQIKTQLFSLHTDIDLSYRMLEQIQKDPLFPLSLPLFSSKLEQGITTLLRVRTDMQTAERLLLLYPYISGYKKPLTILVLLQNNTELRPTGGFIGSLLHITIEDGSITNMRVEDVYTVDGQLKGHVDPPNPIREVLTQEHWYLRDSNWNPDFAESAQKAMWFYEKETGESVNGVIALNASLIVNLLKLTGPIRLMDGGDEITADNFYAKSLQYTQTDFFPGSTQKKDFLGNLMSSLTTTIFQNKKISGVHLFETVDQALRERDAQMYFTDPEAQQLVEQFDWAGKLPTKQPCTSLPSALCLFQYYGSIEANLGINKANYYVERNDTRDITIDATGMVKETITRTIKNIADGQPGSGTYRNYMRFYLPKTTHITAFTINGISVPAKAMGSNVSLMLPYGEIDTTTNAFTMNVAGIFDVPPKQEATVSITDEYLSQEISNLHDMYMIVYTQKQSGIETVPTLIRIHYPSSWTVRNDDQTDPSALANTGYLEYNSTMLQDSSIQIHFLKE